MSDIHNIITDNIDIWTSAIEKKKTSGRGSSKKHSLYGIKKLRELILDLAVRGKLVPQDPTDEPASILLEKIKAEKEQLIKDKKIKKPKKLPEITEEEKTFGKPNNWEWVRLGNVIQFINGYSFKSGDYQDCGIGIVKIGDIQNGIVSEFKMSYVSDTITNCLNENLKINNGDLVIAMSGATTGKLGVNCSNKTFYLNQRVGKIIPYIIDKSYIKLPLVTKIEENLSISTGSAIPNLSTTQINDIVLALPPENEQKRIVSKVNELMALCDKLEQETEESIEAHKTLVEILLNTLTNSTNHEELTSNWNRISEYFDSLFVTEENIEQLKQTILQLAVMGKLVPQDPTGEPVSALLEKIKNEKEKLIKDDKIKKSKKLLEITEDEKPFELPKGWVWSRIGDSTLFTEYGMSEKTYSDIDGVPVLKMGDIQHGVVKLGGQKKVNSEVESLPDLYLKTDDVLYNRTNSAELVGKTGIFKGEDNTYTFASYLIRIRCYSPAVNPDYLNLSMNAPYFRKTQINKYIKKQCGQANVNGTFMKNMLIPIGPLAEQKCILEKVNELMSLCDRLAEKLGIDRENKVLLADSIIKSAI